MSIPKSFNIFLIKVAFLPCLPCIAPIAALIAWVFSLEVFLSTSLNIFVKLFNSEVLKSAALACFIPTAFSFAAISLRLKSLINFSFSLSSIPFTPLEAPLDNALRSVSPSFCFSPPALAKILPILVISESPFKGPEDFKSGLSKRFAKKPLLSESTFLDFSTFPKSPSSSSLVNGSGSSSSSNP